MIPVAAVSGGTGFLGRYVVAALAASGWQVRLLARGGRVAGALGCHHREVPVEIVPGDLGDATALLRLVRGAAVVVHLAALVAARRKADFDAVNRDGTAALLEAVARAAPEARFVLVSSQAARMPALSPYAGSKHAGEAVVRAALPPTRWIVLRPGVVYGPGDVAGRAVLRLAQVPVAPVPWPPEPVIAMIHAHDAAAAIVAACRPEPSGLVWELCDGRTGGHPWREIVGAAARAQGRAPPRFLPVPDPVLRAAGVLAQGWSALGGRTGPFGIGKVREILHRDWGCDPRLLPPATFWQPQIPLDRGMAETVAWWREAVR